MRAHLFALFAVAGMCMSTAAQAQDSELLETGTDSPLYMSDAVYYPADGDRAVVFVTGFIFNKESWKSVYS